jgi:hypothetical protein
MQAMLLLLKAREASPKRGYFWRSWMTVVNLVAMGKGLELDEHHENHQMGKSCGSNVHDCITKTRVWHMLFILEVMVGGPQGSCTVSSVEVLLITARAYKLSSRTGFN